MRAKGKCFSYVPKEEIWDYMPEFTEWFVAKAEERSYDIVHANFWMSGTFAMETKRRLGIPFVITFHALGKVRRQYQGARDRSPLIREHMEEEIIREADRIIAECPEDEQHLIRLYDAPTDSITQAKAASVSWPKALFAAGHLTLAYDVR